MSELECPYCGGEVEPGEEREQDQQNEAECPHCGKNFVYTVTWYPTYSSQKAPCLNGEPHNFVKISGIPDSFFINRRRCTYCGEEKVIKSEVK